MNSRDYGISTLCWTSRITWTLSSSNTSQKTPWKRSGKQTYRGRRRSKERTHTYNEAKLHNVVSYFPKIHPSLVFSCIEACLQYLILSFCSIYPFVAHICSICSNIYLVLLSLLFVTSFYLSCLSHNRCSLNIYYTLQTSQSEDTFEVFLDLSFDGYNVVIVGYSSSNGSFKT